MGGCCSCLKPKKSDLSPASSPSHQAGYGATKSGALVQDPQRETERLLKSGTAPEHASVPKLHKKHAEPTGEQGPSLGKIEEETPCQISQDEKNVSITPLPHNRLRALSDRTSSLSSVTTSEETYSEGETSALVANAENREREKHSKIKRPGKHHGALVSRVNKTAGKVKKAITGKEKDGGVEKRPKTKGSADQLEKPPRLGRVDSSKMKSKYAREKLEERERKEKEKYNSGFRDPRQAAAERGEKLGELEDATSQLRDQAQGFAHTAALLRQAKKK